MQRTPLLLLAAFALLPLAGCGGGKVPARKPGDGRILEPLDIAMAPPPGAAACCSTDTLTTCCEPTDKAECCGTEATTAAAPSSCGCQ